MKKITAIYLHACAHVHENLSAVMMHVIAYEIAMTSYHLLCNQSLKIFLSAENYILVCLQLEVLYKLPVPSCLMDKNRPF